MTSTAALTSPAPTGHVDWYVYTYNGNYYTVDTVDGKPIRSGPSTSRDIAQATMRGKFRN